MGSAPVQRSPIEFDVSECDRGTSQRTPRPTRAVEAWVKKKRQPQKIKHYDWTY